MTPNTTFLKKMKTKAKCELNIVNNNIKNYEVPAPIFYKKQQQLTKLIHELNYLITKDTVLTVH